MASIYIYFWLIKEPAERNDGEDARQPGEASGHVKQSFIRRRVCIRNDATNAHKKGHNSPIDTHARVNASVAKNAAAALTRTTTLAMQLDEAGACIFVEANEARQKEGTARRSIRAKKWPNSSVESSRDKKGEKSREWRFVTANPSSRHEYSKPRVYIFFAVVVGGTERRAK